MLLKRFVRVSSLSGTRGSFQDEANGAGEDSNSRSADKENRHKKKRSRSRSRGRDRKRRSRSRDRRSRSRERRSRSRDRRSRSRGRRPSRSLSRERKRRSKTRSRSRGRDKRRASKSRSQERPPERSRERKRSPSPRKDVKRRRSFSKSPIRNGKISPYGTRPPRPLLDEMTPEERDMRTIFCMQLSQRVRAGDLEDFFSSVGKVRDVRLIIDNKTRRSKGIAYVEFQDVDSVPLAMGLNNQKLFGVPIVVQPTQAEKNRAAASVTSLQRGTAGPMRLYVGSLHFNITEEMLRGIFEPFGKVGGIDKIELIKDLETGRSKGYGFITFHDSEDAKKALEQLNGFELAGRPMKVGHVTERTDLNQAPSFLDSEELDRSGIDLGATGRLQLMAKLAEGTGFQIPQAAVNALQMNPLGLPGSQTSSAPPIATQCFMLSNMFDPFTETNPSWDEEIRNDVLEECRKHGGVLHCYVDKASPNGNVYAKCPTIAAAVASVNALHGRWFAGRIITAAYVPVLSYNTLFPDSVNATTLL